MFHSISDACVRKEKIYFFDDITQAICEFSDSNDSVKILAVNDKKFFESGNIFFYRDCLYVASRRTLDILKYESNSKTIKTICQKDIKVNQQFLFDYHMISEHRLWSFPNHMCQPVCYYDFNSGEFVEGKKIEKNNNMLTRFSSSFESCYWSALYKTNKYFKYDLKQQNIKLYEISDKKMYAAAICFDGEYLWVSSSNNSEIYKCTKTGEVIGKFDGKGKAGGETFARLYAIDQYVIAVPRFGEFIFFIDKRTDEVKRFYLKDIDVRMEMSPGKASKILKCLKYKNKFVFFGFGIDAFIILDMDDMEVRNIPIILSREDLEKINYANVVRNNVTVENETICLKNLNKAISHGNHENEKSNILNENQFGTVIYKMLIKGR